MFSWHCFALEILQSALHNRCQYFDRVTQISHFSYNFKTLLFIQIAPKSFFFIFCMFALYFQWKCAPFLVTCIVIFL